MITDRKIATLTRGRWLRDPAPKGAGRLLIRKTLASALIWYFRYTLPTGTRDTLRLGVYDSKGRAGLSTREARQKSGELSRLYQSGIKDLRAHLAGQRHDVHASVVVEPNGSNAESPSVTLKALIDAYIAALERRDKPSVKAVRYALYHYVVEPFPELCARAAASIKKREFRDVLHAMRKKDIGRTTAAVRSYLNAAYRYAMQAEDDPDAPPELLAFEIEHSPLASIKTMKNLSVPGERALSEQELGAYLMKVRAIPSTVTRSALLLGLLLGGQRMKQLTRIRIDDTVETHTVRDSEGIEHQIRIVTIMDPKGARAQPRRHVLPLFGEAAELVAALTALHPNGPYLLTNDGKTPLNPNTASHEVGEISKQMLLAKVAAKKFKLADIRRTCETRMAELGVTIDIRAHIQSHGLSGIQHRHYDKYGYLKEKFEALQAWTKALAKFEASASKDALGKEVDKPSGHAE